MINQSLSSPSFYFSRSEIGILTATSLLHRIVRQVTSDALLEQIVYFLLGEDRDPETLSGIQKIPLRHRLIEHCNHISDEVSAILPFLGDWFPC